MFEKKTVENFFANIGGSSSKKIYKKKNLRRRVVSKLALLSLNLGRVTSPKMHFEVLSAGASHVVSNKSFFIKNFTLAENRKN